MNLSWGQTLVNIDEIMKNEKFFLNLHFDTKNQSGQHLQVRVIGGPFKESYRRYFYQK